MIFDDIEFWQVNNTYDLREIALRLHHRMVYVHPFPNGNGRFSRLFADLLLWNNDEVNFTWGSCSLVEDSTMRKQYILALREADKGDYQKLIEFADS